MLATNDFNVRFTIWLVLGFGLLLLPPLSYADSGITERIEWKRVPIRLNLTVGQERLVHFPASVKVGLPAVLQPLLRTQSVNGTVYFRANAPFDAIRIMVRTVDGGQVYLFDVSASKEGGQTHPVQVFVEQTGAPESEPTDSNSGRTERPATIRYAANSYATNSYAALTRFAAQQLYAPARLLQTRPGRVRVPVARDPVTLMRGGAIKAEPLVAWRAGGLYVTAVKLTNTTHQPQTLDPRNLRGAWLTATFQHHRLLAAGSDADTTAVYLISARPFSVLPIAVLW